MVNGFVNYFEQQIQCTLDITLINVLHLILISHNRAIEADNDEQFKKVEEHHDSTCRNFIWMTLWEG